MSTSPQTPAPAPGPTPPHVAWTRRLEEAKALDPLVGGARRFAGWFVAEPTRRNVLRGEWLGHALHPVLTDVPIGLWTAAVTLDVLGGRDARPAAQRLVALGVLSAVPTAWTGWAEYADAGQREQRVGLVHAVANGGAIVMFARSWSARRRGEHARGAAIGLAAAGLLGLGGYLGGHLVSARKVGSHHPAFGPS